MWNDKPIPRGLGITDQLEAFKSGGITYEHDIDFGLGLAQQVHQVNLTTSGSQAIRSINQQLGNLNRPKSRSGGRPIGVLNKIGATKTYEDFKGFDKPRATASYVSASQIGTVKQ